MVALGDFVRAGDEPARQLARGATTGERRRGRQRGRRRDDGDDRPIDPAWAWRFNFLVDTRPWWLAALWYSRLLVTAGSFWRRQPLPATRSHGGVAPAAPRRGAAVVGPPHGTRTPPVAVARARWTPVARATMFAPPRPACTRRAGRSGPGARRALRRAHRRPCAPACTGSHPPAQVHGTVAAASMACSTAGWATRGAPASTAACTPAAASTAASAAAGGSAAATAAAAAAAPARSAAPACPAA